MRFLRKLLTGSLISEKRSVAYAITLGVWLLVALYAILHDQYLVRIAPEHFTVYHAPIWGLDHPHAIAAAWAFKASILPGVLLGLATAFCARHGALPKLGFRGIFIGTIVVIVLSEISAVGFGLWTYLTNRVPFPETWYPDKSHGMRITQTIQLVTYLASAGFSALWLMFILRWRRKRREGSPHAATTIPEEVPTGPEHGKQ